MYSGGRFAGEYLKLTMNAGCWVVSLEAIVNFDIQGSELKTMALTSTSADPQIIAWNMGEVKS